MKTLNLSATGSWTCERTFQVDLDASIAVQLLLAVPMSCESLSISEFVARVLSEGPPLPLLHLPRLRTLQLDCGCGLFEQGWNGMYITRMIEGQAAGFTALEKLVVRTVISL